MSAFQHNRIAAFIIGFVVSALLALTAVFFVATSESPAMTHAAIFVIWIVVLLPAMEIAALRALDHGTVLRPRRQRFLYTALILNLNGVFAVDVAQLHGYSLFPEPRIDSIATFYAAAALLICMLSLKRRVRNLPAKRLKRIRLFAPATYGDLPMWLLVSISAGIWEEVVYRGTLVHLLTPTIGLGAVLISVAAFTLAHAGYSWKNLPVIAALALFFHVLAYATGSLYLGMAVHTLYDIGIGLIYISVPEPTSTATNAAENPA